MPFAHHYVESREELAKCYHALDIYLVTSREEGGPMALMESMSSHVPVVSTRVGARNADIARALRRHRTHGQIVGSGGVPTNRIHTTCPSRRGNAHR